MTKNMNFLFKDDYSKSFLSQYTEIISIKLKVKQINEIKKSNITLIYSSSPAEVISNFCFPRNTKKNYEHIISIDKNFIYLKNNDNKLIFKTTDIVALIMHEIGHVMNEPDTLLFPDSKEYLKQKEYYADDFVRSSNPLVFKNYIVSLHNKTINNDIPYISKEQKEELIIRLKKLESNENYLNLIGHIKLTNNLRKARNKKHPKNNS